MSNAPQGPKLKDYDGDYRAAFIGEHLQAADFDKPHTMVIRRIVKKEIEDTNRVKKERLTVFLSALNGREIERGWLISKTAAVCLSHMFGERAAGWKGKRVTLYKDPGVRFGEEVTGGIRVLGSPDIDADTRVTIRFQRKKPYQVRLKRVELGKEAAAAIDDPSDLEGDPGPPMDGDERTPGADDV